VPGAIGRASFSARSATPALRSAFGVAAGNGERTTAKELDPATLGVDVPQSEVNREMPFGPGALLRKFRARR
jgi:hypothetical protein